MKTRVKKVPLDSEDPRDVRVEISKEGHLRTFIQGLAAPIFGFPHRSAVKSMERWKKVVRMLVNGAWNSYHDVFPDPKNYSPQVKEVYRVMTLTAERWQQAGQVEFIKRIRDLFCFFLEMDMAYREPFVWAATEVDIRKLRPRKEDTEFWKTRKDFNYGVNRRKLRG